MADSKVIPPSRQTQLSVNGYPEQRFSAWCEAVTGAINGIEMEGSPEGLVDAARFRLCVNVLTGTLYIKTTSAGILTGWKEL